MVELVEIGLNDGKVSSEPFSLAHAFTVQEHPG
jgi:hypothetical protein